MKQENNKVAKFPLAKKIFVVGKVYDTAILTEKEIETSVQSDIDAWIGRDKVIFTKRKRFYREKNIVAFRLLANV